eukprot:CAMPEP_0175602708 /NCGR_PEP_ID=MMETSP0096-20121207/58778_1 /TAXON_ID=311494 /ORGANISM="Alexandrium monilatum, Strain CCMP3105" /LENGTH=318 /DNA_ID=CAMNT_0016907393 /DNA_START=102 /DNA_END=1055 /DNA_ORIENTATION=+
MGSLLADGLVNPSLQLLGLLQSLSPDHVGVHPAAHQHKVPVRLELADHCGLRGRALLAVAQAGGLEDDDVRPRAPAVHLLLGAMLDHGPQDLSVVALGVDDEELATAEVEAPAIPVAPHAGAKGLQADVDAEFPPSLLAAEVEAWVRPSHARHVPYVDQVSGQLLLDVRRHRGQQLVVGGLREHRHLNVLHIVLTDRRLHQPEVRQLIGRLLPQALNVLPDGLHCHALEAPWIALAHHLHQPTDNGVPLLVASDQVLDNCPKSAEAYLHGVDLPAGEAGLVTRHFHPLLPIPIFAFSPAPPISRRGTGLGSPAAVPAA